MKIKILGINYDLQLFPEMNSLLLIFTQMETLIFGCTQPFVLISLSNENISYYDLRPALYIFK